ncbi:MAG TPA: hypothetical protein VG034_19065 [Acidimicrobiia bacterium]|nr:hypothetical protein [Acidimicrobiia bacterium]
MGDDGVVLTDRERQALAGLAEQIEDPWLARQLAGQDAGQEAPPPNQKRRFAGSILHRLTSASTSRWVGLLLLLAGAVLVMTTFVYSTVLGTLGLLVMGAGLWRLLVNQGDVILGRLRSERRAPAPVPPPPRTPPAAS